MVELLFLIAFAIVLFFSGISMIGMVLAVAAGFVVMAIAGMIGVMFKMLPWLILIAVVIWFYRERNAEKRHREKYFR
ncbi:envelope stress response protein PspG [Photobacterium sanctipauli]|uniref:Envelope stress response protein PspG n=1 Tax=Photobacterium sanctipauli TaxID=1342794 RepID=A0A2T3NA17_9GAMM|nr:envelope stress response protein PspG [Photobacterium sanctipauli]PSW10484.1 envelope stress response protein PspG [Photobacterium sanctipauli]